MTRVTEELNLNFYLVLLNLNLILKTYSIQLLENVEVCLEQLGYVQSIFSTYEIYIQIKYF